MISLMPAYRCCCARRCPVSAMADIREMEREKEKDRLAAVSPKSNHVF